jgi:hypothetical protein
MIILGSLFRLRSLLILVEIRPIIMSDVELAKFSWRSGFTSRDLQWAMNLQGAPYCKAYFVEALRLKALKELNYQIESIFIKIANEFKGKGSGKPKHVSELFDSAHELLSYHRQVLGKITAKYEQFPPCECQITVIDIE